MHLACDASFPLKRRESGLAPRSLFFDDPPSDPFHLQQTVPSPTALNLAAIQSQVRKERECMHLLESVLTKKFVLLLYRFVSECDCKIEKITTFFGPRVCDSMDISNPHAFDL